MAVAAIAATTMPSAQNKYNRTQAKIFEPVKTVWHLHTCVPHCTVCVCVCVYAVYSLHSISQKYMIIFMNVLNYAIRIWRRRRAILSTGTKIKRSNDNKRQRDREKHSINKCTHKSIHLYYALSVCITYALLMGHSTENQTNYNIIPMLLFFQRVHLLTHAVYIHVQ